MAFEQALRGSAVLLAGTGFIGLLLARSVPAMLAALTLAVLIYAVLQLVGWPFGRRITLPASPVLWNSLLISAFFLFLLDSIGNAARISLQVALSGIEQILQQTRLPRIPYGRAGAFCPASPVAADRLVPLRRRP